MSEIHTALQDINWLSQRLKGIMALSEEIESYDRMKEQALDLEKSISSKKEEVSKLLSSKESINKELSDLSFKKSEVLKSTQTEVDSLYSKHRIEASLVLDKAKKEAKELRAAVEAERVAYAEKINTAKENLETLTSNVKVKQTIYDGLMASIDKIKAKF